jgi:hypothetical protein
MLLKTGILLIEQVTPNTGSGMKRKKSDKWDFDPLSMDEASHGELIQLARRLGATHASRQVPREDLEDLILGVEIPVEDPLDYIRRETFDYISKNSLMLSTLRCSTHCPTCPQAGVVHCFAINSDLVLSPEENPIT